MASGRGEDHPNDVHSVREVSSVVGSVEVPILAKDPDPEVGDVRLSAGARAALQSLDDLNLVEEPSRRPSVMKSPFAFLRGAFRSALKLAIQEAVQGCETGDLMRQGRGWKLLMMLPRMLLFKLPRGGSIGKERLWSLDRFDLQQSRVRSGVCKGEPACTEAEPRWRLRAKNGEHIVWSNLANSLRHAKPSRVQIWHRNTLEALQARPGLSRDPLPDDIVGHVLAGRSSWRRRVLVKTSDLRAEGPRQGLRALPMNTSENVGAMHVFFSDQLARASVPGPIIDALRLGRMTAFQKPNGWHSRNCRRRHHPKIGLTYNDPANGSCSGEGNHHQYALSTRAGCECVSHALQTMCEANPETTLVSIDGVSAFDSISREAMFDGPLGGCGRREGSPVRSSSMGDLHSTCGRTILVMSTQSSRAKRRNKGTLSCPSCTPLGSTKQHWTRS